MTFDREKARAVLLSRGPRNPEREWLWWIEGVLDELEGCVQPQGFVLSPEEAAIAAKALRRYGNEQVFPEDAPRFEALAARLEVSS